MATTKHGDLDHHLSTAIDYPFCELVFQKRAGNTKIRGFQLKNIYLTELTLKKLRGSNNVVV